MASYHLNMSDMSSSPDLSPLSMLHVAAVNGDKSSIEVLLKRSHLEEYNCDVNEQDKYGRTALVYTIFSDWYDCAELLIGNGAMVCTEDRDKRTPFHWAAYLGKQKFISLLLRYVDTNIDWNTGDLDGRAPLHYAAAHRNSKCLRILLRYVPTNTLDLTDREKKTPLHYSVYYGNFEQVKLLREAGAKVHLRDAKWNSLLHLAVANASPDSVKIVRYLLKMNRFYSTQKDCEGRTALQLAVAKEHDVLVKELSMAVVSALDELDSLSRSALHYAVLRNNVNIVNILISSGASLYREDNAGATPLHYVAKNNSIEVLQCLLLYKKLEDMPDRQGRTALMWAASEGSRNVLSLMLKNPRFDVHARDNKGLTALHFACLAGHLACVMLLISNSADVRQPDKLGQTALFKACQQGHVNVADFLMNNEMFYLGNFNNSKGPSVTIADQQGQDGMSGAREECNRTFEGESHSTSNGDNQRGFSAVTPAAKNRCSDNANDNNAPGQKETNKGTGSVLKATSDDGESPRTNTQGDQSGKVSTTGGRLAINRKECIRTLEDCNGCTPLHFAAHAGHVAVCKWLLDNGVDPLKRDTSGRTALHGAAFNGHITCMALMLENCPLLKNSCDDEGYCALHRAAINGHLEAVKLLVLEYNAFANFRVKSTNLTPLDLAMGANQQDVTQFLIDHGGLTIAGVQEVASDTIKRYFRKRVVTQQKTTLKPLIEKHMMLTGDKIGVKVAMMDTTEEIDGCEKASVTKHDQFGGVDIMVEACDDGTAGQEHGQHDGTSINQQGISQQTDGTCITYEQSHSAIPQDGEGDIVEKECDGALFDHESGCSIIQTEKDDTTANDKPHGTISVEKNVNCDKKLCDYTIQSVCDHGTPVSDQHHSIINNNEKCENATIDHNVHGDAIEPECGYVGKQHDGTKTTEHSITDLSGAFHNDHEHDGTVLFDQKLCGDSACQEINVNMSNACVGKSVNLVENASIIDKDGTTVGQENDHGLQLTGTTKGGNKPTIKNQEPDRVTQEPDCATANKENYNITLSSQQLNNDSTKCDGANVDIPYCCVEGNNSGGPTIVTIKHDFNCTSMGNYGSDNRDCDCSTSENCFYHGVQKMRSIEESCSYTIADKTRGGDSSSVEQERTKVRYDEQSPVYVDQDNDRNVKLGQRRLQLSDRTEIFIPVGIPNGQVSDKLVCRRQSELCNNYIDKQQNMICHHNLLYNCPSGGNKDSFDDKPSMAIVDKALKSGDENDEVVSELGPTVLHLAAQRGDSTECANLIASGEDVRKRDHKGKTALHCAALYGHLECVQLLLDCEPNLVSIPDFSDHTALHCAASNGHLEIVKLLVLTYNALKEGTCYFACPTALDCALLGDHLNVVEFLTSQGAKTRKVLEKSATIIKMAWKKWYRAVFETTASSDKSSQENQNFSKLAADFESLKIQPDSTLNGTESCESFGEFKHTPVRPSSERTNSSRSEVSIRCVDNVLVAYKRGRIVKMRDDWDRVDVLRRNIRAAIVIQRCFREYLYRKRGHNNIVPKTRVIKDPSSKVSKGSRKKTPATRNFRRKIKTSEIDSAQNKGTDRKMFKSCFPTISQSTAANSYKYSTYDNNSEIDDFNLAAHLTTNEAIERWLTKGTMGDNIVNRRLAKRRAESEKYAGRKNNDADYLRSQSLPGSHETSDTRVRSNSTQDTRRRTVSTGFYRQRCLSRETETRRAYTTSPAAASYNFALDTYQPLASRRGGKQTSLPFKTNTRVRPSSMGRDINGWVQTTLPKCGENTPLSTED